ncbi:uncharacterized protein BDR25DRAFT_339891 [Lindgomyces ingoldianus]|uniref:Uncharacterized protein n=1 Tax=Lindgomyces ingoldianus TaxID=673940 RepID=A0ACB6R9N3_9PLEO|nr:uncharacterized protein BDR25DRAFT_339891 [Lindgomyces ingoldianus]KAF2475993.1 hypothetical protein BDR25DRAFT_339891 [Lindgomyces ingoldianus]
MPAYRSAGIRVRIGAASLADTITPDLELLKAKARPKSERAEDRLRKGELLVEENVPFPGDEECMGVNFLGNVPFLQARVGKDLFKSGTGDNGEGKGVDCAKKNGRGQAFTGAGTGGHRSQGPAARTRSHTPAAGSEAHVELPPHGAAGFDHTDSEPKALAVHVLLTDTTFFPGLYDKPRHLKIEVFFNGILASCVRAHPIEVRQDNSLYHQMFSGSRIEWLAERPWVFLPPGQNADGSFRGPSMTIGAQERWGQICAALLEEADERGFDENGERPPSAAYLESLAVMQMPEDVKDMQKPGGRSFGVVDVVIAYGQGKKLTAGVSYLKEVTRMVDGRYTKRDRGKQEEEPGRPAASPTSLPPLPPSVFKFGAAASSASQVDGPASCSSDLDAEGDTDSDYEPVSQVTEGGHGLAWTQPQLMPVTQESFLPQVSTPLTQFPPHPPMVPMPDFQSPFPEFANQFGSQFGMAPSTQFPIPAGFPEVSERLRIKAQNFYQATPSHFSYEPPLRGLTAPPPPHGFAIRPGMNQGFEAPSLPTQELAPFQQHLQGFGYSPESNQAISMSSSTQGPAVSHAPHPGLTFPTKPVHSFEMPPPTSIPIHGTSAPSLNTPMQTHAFSSPAHSPYKRSRHVSMGPVNVTSFDPNAPPCDTTPSYGISHRGMFTQAGSPTDISSQSQKQRASGQGYVHLEYNPFAAQRNPLAEGPLPPVGLFPVTKRPRPGSFDEVVGIIDPNQPRSSILVDRLVITGKHGAHIVDHQWKIAQRVAVKHEYPIPRPSRTSRLQESPESAEYIQPSTISRRRTRNAQPVDPTTPPLTSPGPTQDLDMTVSVDRTKRGIIHEGNLAQIFGKPPTMGPTLSSESYGWAIPGNGSEREIGEQGGDNSCSDDGVQTLPATPVVASNSRVPESSSDVGDFQQARGKMKSKQKELMVQGNEKPVVVQHKASKVSARQARRRPSTVVEFLGDDDGESSELSSVPSSPEPEVRNVGRSTRRNPNLLASTNDSDPDFTPITAASSSSYRQTTQSQLQLGSKVQRVRQPRRLDPEIFVDNPALNQDCAIAFAQAGPWANGLGLETAATDGGECVVLRQVKAERMGWFSEEGVVIGVRYFVEG